VVASAEGNCPACTIATLLYLPTTPESKAETSHQLSSALQVLTHARLTVCRGDPAETFAFCDNGAILLNTASLAAKCLP
jgi:hypothetical protein